MAILFVAAAVLGLWRFGEYRRGQKAGEQAFDAIGRISGVKTAVGFDERVLEARKALDDARHSSLRGDAVRLLTQYLEAEERKGIGVPKQPSDITNLQAATACEDEAGIAVGAFSSEVASTKPGDCDRLNKLYMEQLHAEIEKR